MMLRYLLSLTLVGLLSIASASAQDVDPLDARLERLEQMVALMQSEIQAIRRDRVQTTTVAVQDQPAAPVTPPAVAAQAERPRSSDQPVAPRPIAWSGEFRLMLDSLTRPAGATSPPVGNTRGRYFLHLDIAASPHRTVDLRTRLSTGILNNPLADIQDFGGGTAKHPFSIAEAYVDYHPNPNIVVQGGRVDSIFNDRARFLYDLDTRFNGTNESVQWPLASRPLGISALRFRAGQYFFTNPNVPVIADVPGSTAAGASASAALVASGAEAGSRGKVSALFQQGVAVDQRLTGNLTQRFGVDLSLFREPNQLQMTTLPGGLSLIASTLGVLPAGGLPGVGNALKTAGGGRFTADAFRIVHADYAIEHRGLPIGPLTLPAGINLQFSRNLGADFAKDAWMAGASLGRTTPRNLRVGYNFYRKEANSMVGPLTENDLAIGSSVNMRAQFLRVEYAAVRNVSIWLNAIRTTFIEGSDPTRSFFVPLGPTVPAQFRYQLMLVSRF